MLIPANDHPCEIEEDGQSVQIRFHSVDEDESGNQYPETLTVTDLTFVRWQAIKPHFEEYLLQTDATVVSSPAAEGATLRAVDQLATCALAEMIVFSRSLSDDADLAAVAQNWFQDPAAWNRFYAHEAVDLLLAQLRLNKEVWTKHGIAYGTRVLFLKPRVLNSLVPMVFKVGLPVPRTFKHAEGRVRAQWDVAVTSLGLTLGLRVAEEDNPLSGLPPRQGFGVLVTTAPVSCVDRLFIPPKLQLRAVMDLVRHFEARTPKEHRAEFRQVKAELQRVARLVFGKDVSLSRRRKLKAKAQQDKS